jgi:hypothetical protein
MSGQRPPAGPYAAGQDPAGMSARPAPVVPAESLSAARMTERQLENAVRRILKDLPQVMAYHTYDSRRSAHGWPDLVFARRHVRGYPGGAVMFRELKTERGKVTPEQEAWLEALHFAGFDTGVWRPAQLLDGAIARELAALAGLKIAEVTG